MFINTFNNCIFSINTFNISAHNMNKQGDIGSPCLHPLLMSKIFDKLSHCITVPLILVFRIVTHLIKIFPKLKCFNTLLIKTQDIESKAF